MALLKDLRTLIDNGGTAVCVEKQEESTTKYFVSQHALWHSQFYPKYSLTIIPRAEVKSEATLDWDGVITGVGSFLPDGWEILPGIAILKAQIDEGYTAFHHVPYGPRNVEHDVRVFAGPRGYIHELSYVASLRPEPQQTPFSLWKDVVARLGSLRDSDQWNIEK